SRRIRRVMRASDANEGGGALPQSPQRKGLICSTRAHRAAFGRLTRRASGDQRPPTTTGEHNRSTDRGDVLQTHGGPFFGGTLLTELPTENTPVQIRAVTHEIGDVAVDQVW